MATPSPHRSCGGGGGGAAGGGWRGCPAPRRHVHAPFSSCSCSLFLRSRRQRAPLPAQPVRYLRRGERATTLASDLVRGGAADRLISGSRWAAVAPPPWLPCRWSPTPTSGPLCQRFVWSGERRRGLPVGGGERHWWSTAAGRVRASHAGPSRLTGAAAPEPAPTGRAWTGRATRWRVGAHGSAEGGLVQNSTERSGVAQGSWHTSSSAVGGAWTSAAPKRAATRSAVGGGATDAIGLRVFRSLCGFLLVHEHPSVGAPFLLKQ